MLILTGISINATIGRNGILTKAQNASMSTKIASVKEQIEMYRLSQQLNKKTGLDLYPILQNADDRVSMKSKLEDGSLKLKDLESELKHYLVKRVGQKDAEILADVNNISLYSDYYFINTTDIPAAKSIENKLVIYVYNDNSYDIIYFDGYDWDNTGAKSYALSITNHDSAESELANLSTYYASENNTYKLYGTGKVKVIGEITEDISQRLEYSKNENASKLDLIAIAKKYSISTTTTYNSTYDCIGIENGNNVYVKKLYILNGYDSYGNTVYIIDMNNDLWAWESSENNKLGLGTTGLIEKPTKLLQGMKDESNLQIKIKNVWGNISLTVVETTDNQILICGNNSSGLLGQGDAIDHESWVKPNVLNNFKDVYDSNAEKDISELKANSNDSHLKEVYLSEDNSEQAIFLQFDNGDFYGGGLGSLAVGQYSTYNYYIKVDEIWNEQIKSLLENENISTKNIISMSNYATTRFLVFDTQDVLVFGWNGSGAYGDNKSDKALNRCIDWDENYISGVKEVKGRKVILTNNNIYWTRTFLEENGNYKMWYHKALPLSNIPSDFNFDNAFLVGYGLAVSNGKLWNIYYNPEEVTFNIVKNDSIGVEDIIKNKAIVNDYSFDYRDITTLTSCIMCTSNYEFYGLNIDDISLSEEKNLYQLTSIGFDNVKYVTTDYDGIKLLLDDNTIINNLNDESSVGLSSNEFITNIVSDRSTTSVLCNDGNGNRYVKLKGSKYAGCWGASESNSKERINEFIKENPGSIYPGLGLNDVGSFQTLKKNNTEILDNVKKIFTNNKYVTSYDYINHSGSIILDNNGNLYWFGTYGHSQRVYLPGIEFPEKNYYGYGVFNFRATDYPVLYQNDVLEEFKEEIKDIAFSDINIEGGLTLANTSILTKTGDIYVYGTNSSANGVGHGMRNFEQLELPEKIDKIYSAYGLSLAISENGNVYAWGYDYYKVTGIGSSNINTPVKLDISDVYYIANGKGFCIYACTNGKVYGIGKNNYGQLGTGDNVSHNTFVECVELEK